jgi:hypothetical protein
VRRAHRLLGRQRDPCCPRGGSHRLVDALHPGVGSRLVLARDLLARDLLARDLLVETGVVDA